jgi:rSAM/selenodomain-associated transferase 1
MRRLLIFVKEPIPGQVKTRLAGEIGADAACSVYRQCVGRTLDRLSVLRDDITLCVDPPEATGRVRAWLGTTWPVVPQHGATLGERLADAIDRAVADGARRVVVIGTDSPWIDPKRIEEAFVNLEHTDLVLGPAADGGYYLVGLAQPSPGVFSGISWSTHQVLDQTLANARDLGLSVSLLPEGYDVDRLTDLQRWMREDPQHGLRVPVRMTRAITPQTRRMVHA